VERSSIRILGLSVSGGTTGAAAATVLEALGERQSVIGSLHPELRPAFDLLLKLRAFSPDRGLWRARAGLSDAAFNALSGAVERQLRHHEGEFDLIFQVQTVFAPGQLEARRPFVVYTDNIMSLTERFYPSWVRLSAAEFHCRRELEARILRSAAHVFAWSEFLRDALINDYECEPGQVSCVGAGANIVLPSLGSRRWDSATAIFVGRDFARKGGLVLLDAWAEVRQRLPHARLIVAGPPRPPEGVDLTGVDWRGPVASRAELLSLYETASVFAMPSLFEPWGHVFLEAMGCGLPCIAADHCAMPEIVSTEQTGLLVAPGEVQPLAEALVRLLEDPPLAEAWGRCAHASVSSQHRWSDVAERISPALASAVNEHPGGLAAADTQPRKGQPRPRLGARAQWRPRD
jgi:glycosyltransferase involved in cell wall biosynthesis